MRRILFAFAAVMMLAGGASAQPADLVVTNARVTTLDDANPQAAAFAVRDGSFVVVGNDDDVRDMIGDGTTIIDAGGRRVIPGLNDSHQHSTRAGRFFNLELRWEGVDTLERGLAMIAEQAERTPDDQWVRVIGGWSPYQFEERRMPTPRELTDAAPETPVFVLFLYSQGFLNQAGVEVLGLDESTPLPEGARYEFVDGGAIIHAEPNPGLLYQTIGKLPGLSVDDQVNSARHYFRDLNRFGVTSAIDAGGGGHVFPVDYRASKRLAESGELPLRVSYYLFPQEKGNELQEFRSWNRGHRVYAQFHRTLQHGYELEGGGEFLVWSAGDFENFMAPRPDLSDREGWEQDLYDVTAFLVEQQWPLRIHATYGESITRILDVFERVKEDAGRFSPRWAFDHAETAQRPQLERIKAMGGGIAIQNRMAFAGEYFLDRYGPEAAAAAPPIREMLDMGIPVGAGTDATRVSSYNPWASLYWLVSGKSVGGTPLLDETNQLSREEALRLWTIGSAWFSQEEGRKGMIAVGQYADFAVLDADYFAIDEDAILDLEAALTVVGGRPVYASEAMADQVEIAPLPRAVPEWSPVNAFGGHQ